MKTPKARRDGWLKLEEERWKLVSELLWLVQYSGSEALGLTAPDEKEFDQVRRMVVARGIAEARTPVQPDGEPLEELRRQAAEYHILLHTLHDFVRRLIREANSAHDLALRENRGRPRTRVVTQQAGLAGYLPKPIRRPGRKPSVAISNEDLLALVELGRDAGHESVRATLKIYAQVLAEQDEGSGEWRRERKEDSIVKNLERRVSSLNALTRKSRKK